MTAWLTGWLVIWLWLADYLVAYNSMTEWMTWLFGWLWLPDWTTSCCLDDSMVQGWSWTTDYSSGQEILWVCAPNCSSQCSQKPATEHIDSDYQPQKSSDSCPMSSGALFTRTCYVPCANIPLASHIYFHLKAILGFLGQRYLHEECGDYGDEYDDWRWQ
jgi:hypothetical protein